MKQLFLPWLIAVVCSRPGFSAILRVPSDYPTIQAALDAAVDGDTVLVAPGEFTITAPLDFNRLHDPADLQSPALKNITLKSEGGAEEPTRAETAPLQSLFGGAT
jgi:hypothetical protein